MRHDHSSHVCADAFRFGTTILGDSDSFRGWRSPRHDYGAGSRFCMLDRKGFVSGWAGLNQIVERIPVLSDRHR